MQPKPPVNNQGKGSKPYPMPRVTPGKGGGKIVSSPLPIKKAPIVKPLPIKKAPIKDTPIKVRPPSIDDKIYRTMPITEKQLNGIKKMYGI